MIVVGRTSLVGALRGESDVAWGLWECGSLMAHVGREARDACWCCAVVRFGLAVGVVVRAACGGCHGRPRGPPRWGTPDRPLRDSSGAVGSSECRIQWVWLWAAPWLWPWPWLSAARPRGPTERFQACIYEEASLMCCITGMPELADQVPAVMSVAVPSMAQRWQRRVAEAGATCGVLIAADGRMALLWQRRVARDGSGCRRSAQRA